MWIHDEDQSWCLLVESKVAAALKTGQLRRHLATARRQDFEDIHLLVLSVEVASRIPGSLARTRTWAELYEFLPAHRRSSTWVQDLIEYFHVLETRMIDTHYLERGTITRFAGIPFDDDHPLSTATRIRSDPALVAAAGSGSLPD